MNKVVKVLGVVLVVGVGVAVFSGDSGSTAAPVDVQQVGYFKSPDNARVLAYLAAGPVPEADALRVFDKVTVTAGQITRAVIYDSEPVPRDALTLAEDVGAALAVTSSPPFDAWAWRLQVNAAGERTVEGR